MTTTGMAPNIGMLPRPPLLPGILLDVIDVLPLDAGAEMRWPMNGVAWTPREAAAALNASDADCAQADLETRPRSCQTAVEQLPFTLSDLFQLSALDWQALDSGEGGVDGEMLGHFNSHLSAAFALELVTAAASGGLSLSSEASAPTGVAFGSAATPLWNALAVIESELAERLLNGLGYIHLPPGLFAQAVDVYGLRWTGDHWVTPLGNVVIVDAGYIDMEAPAGEAASAAATDWIYGSGQVWFRSTEPSLNGPRFTPENFTFATNDIERWTKAQGLLVFEPAFVTAVLVAYDPGV